MLNRSARRRIRNWLAGFVGAWLVRLWVFILRVRLIGFCVEGGAPIPPASGIYVLWHQRLFIPVGFFRKAGLRSIISEHSDGEMIAKIVTRLGMHPIRGSSTRGGAKAVRELLREGVNRSRLHIAITADGPRGPARHFHAGAIFLASRTGIPIYAAAITIQRHWSLPSWDRFHFPKPFSKAVIRIEKPVSVPPDLDRDGIENYRVRMEKELEGLTRDTDQHFEEIYARAKPTSRLPQLESREMSSPSS